MEGRRNFLKGSLAILAGITISPLAKAFASTGNFPSGIIYTSQNPGRWAGKVGGHAPRVTAEGNKIAILNKHPMTEKHFIVRHTLVAENGKVLGDKTFFPSDPTAFSTYDVTVKKGATMFATSFCNIHDFWVTEFTN